MIEGIAIQYEDFIEIIGFDSKPPPLKDKESGYKQNSLDVLEGRRNIHFTSLAGRLKNQGLSSTGILEELEKMNSTLSNPLPQSEIEHICESSSAWWAHLDVTQMRVAERAVSILKKECRSIPRLKLLRRWNGKFWEEDNEEFCMNILDVTRHMIIEELNGPESKQADRNIRELLKLEAIGKLRAIKDAYSLHPDVIDSFSDYDQDIYLLNTQDGVVDIRTGDIGPHDPDLKITKITPYGYGGSCPTWIKFQLDLAQGDQLLVDFRQKIYGLGTVGENPPQKMFIEQGPTATGKTTAQEVIKAVLGPYAKTLPVTLISGSRYKSDAPSPSFADLDGVRAVFLSEFEEDATGKASALKLLNSEETISARQLYRGNQEVKIRATFYAASNYLPKFAHDDPALKRRLQIIPSTRTVEEKDQNPNLQKELISEGAGILEWMVKGYQKLVSESLQPPSAVSRATSSYWSRMDVLRHWYEERCDFNPDSQTPTGDLYFDYSDWCLKAGLGLNQRLSYQEFARKLSANPRLTKTRMGEKKIRGWKGICLPY